MNRPDRPGDLNCRTCTRPVATYNSCSWCARVKVPLGWYFSFGGRGDRQ